MSDSLEERLQNQADELGDRGKKNYGPTADQTTDNFQDDFHRIEQYEREGLLEIIGDPHRESTSGNRHVNMVMVRLTKEGAENWRSKS